MLKTLLMDIVLFKDELSVAQLKTISRKNFEWFKETLHLYNLRPSFCFGKGANTFTAAFLDAYLLSVKLHAESLFLSLVKNFPFKVF